MTKLCAKCGTEFTPKSNRGRYCPACYDPNRHNTRKTRATPEMFVQVDCEGRQDGDTMQLWTVSYGREDGSSASLVTRSSSDTLTWIIDELSGLYNGHRQVVTAFHFTWDSSLLTRDLDPACMTLVHKAGTLHAGQICATVHPDGGRPCGKLHRYDPLDIEAVLTDGGEGDVIAWDPKTKIALAATPKRRFYFEHRPQGDRYEGWRRVDIHDVGTAFTGGLEHVIDTWQPVLSKEQRQVIADGKSARKHKFTGWTDQRICEYSEAECVAAARCCRLLVTTIEAAAGIAIKPGELYGSGSVAGVVFKAKGVSRRKESVQDDQVDDMATMTYFGGMIETPVIGHVVRPVREDDINSAYPHAMSSLPCMRAGHGHWKKITGDLDASKVEGRLGHVLATWSVRTASTPPFMIRLKNGSVRQPLNGVKVWVTAAEYAAGRRRFSYDVSAYRAWLWFQDCDCPPPFDWIIELYLKRLEIKQQMKTVEKGSAEWQEMYVHQEAIKLVLNSCYGKLAQRRPVYGSYTNLHYASHVTGLTRAKLRERTWALEDAGCTVVYQHTDAVLYQGPVQLPESAALGDFKAEDETIDCLIIQPGLLSAKTGKTRSRGVGKDDNGDDLLDQVAWEWSETTDFTSHPVEWPQIEFETKRMISRRMALHRHKSHLAASFTQHPLKIGINPRKRNIMRTTPMRGEPEAWVVPPVQAIPKSDIADITDMQTFLTAVQRRLAEGHSNDPSATPP